MRMIDFGSFFARDAIVMMRGCCYRCWTAIWQKKSLHRLGLGLGWLFGLLLLLFHRYSSLVYPHRLPKS
jgi:hypothetical protein